MAAVERRVMRMVLSENYFPEIATFAMQLCRKAKEADFAQEAR